MTWTKDQREAYLRLLQADAQKARSILAEQGFQDDELATLSPWLFGDRNLVLIIDTILEKGSEPVDVMNAAAIASREGLLLAATFHSGRVDPEPMDLF